MSYQARARRQEPTRPGVRARCPYIKPHQSVLNPPNPPDPGHSASNQISSRTSVISTFDSPSKTAGTQIQSSVHLLSPSTEPKPALSVPATSSQPTPYPSLVPPATPGAAGQQSEANPPSSPAISVVIPVALSAAAIVVVVVAILFFWRGRRRRPTNGSGPVSSTSKSGSGGTRSIPNPFADAQSPRSSYDATTFTKRPAVDVTIGDSNDTRQVGEKLSSPFSDSFAEVAYHARALEESRFTSPTLSSTPRSGGAHFVFGDSGDNGFSITASSRTLPSSPLYDLASPSSVVSYQFDPSLLSPTRELGVFDQRVSMQGQVVNLRASHSRL